MAETFLHVVKRNPIRGGSLDKRDVSALTQSVATPSPKANDSISGGRWQRVPRVLPGRNRQRRRDSQQQSSGRGEECGGGAAEMAGARSAAMRGAAAGRELTDPTGQSEEEPSVGV
ncbi:hypothetical protein J19TS2_51380 [Cohnella xylanilytica]|nr:hypothetical protein J19TS2_51380 [Cohnella xylanilytica]